MEHAHREHPMTTPLAVLDYFGPALGAERSVIHTCWRAFVWAITATLLVLFVTLRAAVLLVGFALVFAGTVLLVIGGKRSAAEKLAQWRERTIDLMRLWRNDVMRPIRAWRSRRQQAQPVSPAS
ncbi:MAG: hypothetical protein QOF78_1935 [Phycisphaerales bacterium]|nr:hypothetical protein [Phycisphaerales bacterium]